MTNPHDQLQFKCWPTPLWCKKPVNLWYHYDDSVSMSECVCVCVWFPILTFAPVYRLSQKLVMLHETTPIIQTHTHYLTNSMDHRLLENLTVSQLVKKLPIFYGMTSFITVLTKALHQSLSCIRWIQSTPSYPISIRSIIKLSSCICLGISCGTFPSGFVTKLCCLALCLHACHMPCQSHPPWFNYPNNSEYKPRSSSLFSFLQPPVTSSL
jgi:hypothetical protein